MTHASGTTTYSYDNVDRLSSKATPEGTLTYTYDAAGNQFFHPMQRYAATQCNEMLLASAALACQWQCWSIRSIITT
jgi:RHS Repeat